MKKFLLLVFSLIVCSSLGAQIVYEDFESTPLTWNPFGDGVFNGVIDNPDPNDVNMSAKVGSYTKSDEHAYSLLIAVLDDPIDLSTMNQFSIDVYAPVASQILFKLEGDGEAIEKIANIANPNIWQTYHFDLSGAAGFTTITKIIIFFDPGTMDSGDTYLFDNIVATAAGPCAGTVADPLIIDDYECQRNATYGQGWDVITQVANPDPDGVNSSLVVGQYEDPPGPWSALVIDYHNALDLSTYNQIKAKVWAPKTGQILFKLEGGVSPPAEVFLDVTETEEWVEYCADFSAQAAANHKKVVIFFNAGVEPEPGDIYFIDDIRFDEQPPAPALEDFENGPTLGWAPLNDDMVNHGTFGGVVVNPDQAGVNGSPNSGKYTKGNAAFSALTAFLPTGIDLSSNPQLNMQVLPPAGAVNVTMQLTSPTEGNKDVTRDFPATGEWVDLEFNFEDHADITDFERVTLLFDPGTAAPGTMYIFDNLTQGQSTVDPCEGVEPISNILDDFECQRNVTYGVGADRLTVIANPDVSAENPSTTVGEYKDPIDEWSALAFESGGSLDLAVQNQFHLKVWSPLAVPLLFKLEGGTSPAAEVWVDVTETGKWVEYVVDFSDQAGEDHARLVVFFNAGQIPAQEDIYYIDDASWTRASYTGCIDDHESPATTISSFSYFANGHLEAEGKQFEVVNNPDPTGINTSAKVGEFVKASDALPFAGMFGDIDAPIDFGSNKVARAKVYMDHIGNFTIKLEGSATGAAPIELPVDNTLTNEWEELIFDFSAVPDDAEYMRITLFFDLGIDATGTDVTSYFDDIVIGDGNCALIDGVFNPVRVEKFTVSPNPVSDVLRIEQTIDVKQIVIYNQLGQMVRTLNWSGTGFAEVNVSELGKGMYTLAGFDQNGQLVANAKFVKN